MDAQGICDIEAMAPEAPGTHSGVSLNVETGYCRIDMRIWDLPAECLCRNHLLAEHRELHAIWSVIINDKRGYSKHPEVMRWRGRLGALWTRHEQQVEEMARRGYVHRSPLDLDSAPRGQREKRQSTLVDSLQEQRAKLRCKRCACNTSKARKTRPQNQNSAPAPCDSTDGL